MMQAYNFPVAFFINTKPLIEKKAITIHKSQYVRSLLSPSEISNELDKYLKLKLDIKVDDPSESLVRRHYRYDDLPVAKQKYILNYILNENQRHELIDALFKKIYKDENKFVEKWYLNENQIKKLSETFRCVGSHSHSHSPLAKMSLVESKNELEISKTYLEKIIDTL